jgi:hypothetical protein
VKLVNVQARVDAHCARILPEDVISKPDIAVLILWRAVLEAGNTPTIVIRHRVVVKIHVAGIGRYEWASAVRFMHVICGPTRIWVFCTTLTRLLFLRAEL